MKLSIVSNAYSQHSFEEVIKHVSRLGYEGVEIARTHPVHELDKQSRTKLLAQLNSLNLKVSAVQGGTPTLDVEFAKERIDLASDLGSSVVNIGPGLDLVNEGDREENWKKAIAGFKELAKYAADKGIKVATEAEPPATGFAAGRIGRSYPRLISTLKDMERILNEVTADNFGILLDVGHMYVMSENPFLVIRKLGKKIFHIHMEDIFDHIHCHFVPGSGGKVDGEGIIRALERVGYEGYLSVEVELTTPIEESDRVALEGIQYLEGLLYRLNLR
ncbi:MAG: sugar phosphate isomerase/epimerase [Candidatus Atribacteria bacterium]|nr:sugar phosphate isomerase/epimerase [Candidatus Atribacteria bacterium]